MSAESTPNMLHAALIVGVIVLSSFLARFVPFFIFAKRTPRVVEYLGRVLPSAIIAMLIVYCLRNVSLDSAPYGLNELIAVAVVAVVHILFKIPVLSIVLGTLCYMALVQSGALLSLIYS